MPACSVQSGTFDACYARCTEREARQSCGTGAPRRSSNAQCPFLETPTRLSALTQRTHGMPGPMRCVAACMHTAAARDCVLPSMRAVLSANTMHQLTSLFDPSPHFFPLFFGQRRACILTLSHPHTPLDGPSSSALSLSLSRDLCSVPASRLGQLASPSDSLNKSKTNRSCQLQVHPDNTTCLCCCSARLCDPFDSIFDSTSGVPRCMSCCLWASLACQNGALRLTAFPASGRSGRHTASINPACLSCSRRAARLR